ncbi:carboxylic ester hydrolase [Podospora conica]|nr:carboxylic ester hydrolase [Schizothecium conicum]
MPDLRSLGLEVPRRSSSDTGASVPWDTVKREHDVTGRSSPSSMLHTVTSSVVSRLAAWKLEIAGLVLALAAMAALVAVVMRFEGRPLAAWPSSAITLNAVVAVLVTVATGGMSVALASGMGQMKWVRFKQGRAPLSDLECFDEASRGAWGGLGLLFRMRGGVTGSFGAMIMILAVFMSPFAQQIVVYRFRTAMVDGGAVSWRALGYDLAAGSGDGGFLPVLSMKAAVYDGLLSKDSEAPWSRLPVECATGNCTFGEIETLAVCGSCVDVSALMTPYCVGGTPPGGDTSKCGWQLPSGAVLNTSADVFSMTPLFPGNINGGSFSTIMRLVFMGVDAGAPKPWALQCSLDTCVQRLRSDVSRGRLTEIVIAQYTNDSVPTTQSAIDTLLPVSITSPVTNETYTMSMRSLQALRSWFADVFRAGAATTSSHEAIQSLYASHLSSRTAGIQESLARLTTAMTSHIRSSPANPTARPVRGHTLLREPYIHIRPAFLLVPATAALAAVAFLAMVAYQTWRTGTQLWKTSALAVLFHGLDHDVRVRFSDLEGLEAKREEARAVKVMLEDDGGVGGGGVLRVQRVY